MFSLFMSSKTGKLSSKRIIGTLCFAVSVYFAYATNNEYAIKLLDVGVILLCGGLLERK
jgi:hypothetical protein